MSDKPDDGGPAFPLYIPEGVLVEKDFNVDGMSLRDWFAGQALMGLCSGSAFEHITKTGMSGIACKAYGFADAMLEARQP
jgi:hypothetical protein